MTSSADGEVTCPDCETVSDSSYCPECGARLALKHRERIQDKLYAGASRRLQPERGAVSEANAPALVTGISIGVIVVGAILPWVRLRIFLGEVSTRGTDGDGVITIILALVAAVVLFLWFSGSHSPRLATALTIIGLVIGGIAVYDIVDTYNKDSELGDLGQASVAEGLWLTLVGGIGLVLGGILTYNVDPVRIIDEPSSKR